MVNLKLQVPFYQKNFPNKLIYRHSMQPNTLTRREYKGKVYVKNIGKNKCRIRNQLKSKIRIQTRKKSFQIHNTARNITNFVIYILYI